MTTSSTIQLLNGHRLASISLGCTQTLGLTTYTPIIYVCTWPLQYSLVFKVKVLEESNFDISDF